MRIFVLLAIVLALYTLVKNFRGQERRSSRDGKSGAAPAATGAAAPSAPVSGQGCHKAASSAASDGAPDSKPQPHGADPAFLHALEQYFYSNWAKDGSIYSDLDQMPILRFSVQPGSDRVIESIFLEGQAAPIINETRYDSLCDAAVIPDLSSPADQQQLSAHLSDYLLGLGTVTRKGTDFYPIRTAKPEDAPAAPAKKSGGPDYETLRAQMQSMLEQMAKDSDRTHP